MNRRYGPFDLDVCALPDNAKCQRYFTPEVDGLKQAWQGRCWMNPPYGKAIAPWIRKPWESSLSVTSDDTVRRALSQIKQLPQVARHVRFMGY